MPDLGYLEDADGALFPPEVQEAFKTAVEGMNHCPVGCAYGGCETCPCCSAGWCVYGLDFRLGDPESFPKTQEERDIWIAVARETNPVLGFLAEHMVGEMKRLWYAAT